ncbi:hypothetical protein LHP98_13320 [Rhodobacter sp. Har01]|nr:hypothetical protein [Rhodobacter sp. Har01]MCB6179099.1 hypothetical protein [Rhodobacter sp. Har01]
MQRLRSIEPGFSLDRMVRDDAYPVAALRRSGILGHSALRDLARGAL